MIKKIIKNICLVAILLVWVALIVVVVRIENEFWKTCAIMGLLSLSYVFLRLYSYIEMYQECEKFYCLVRENNRKRLMSWYKGENNKVQDYIELMQINGDEFLEASEKLIKTFPLLPKKKLNRMTQGIQNMMKREYPPV